MGKELELSLTLSKRYVANSAKTVQIFLLLLNL